jgi:hypothetical protein
MSNAKFDLVVKKYMPRLMIEFDLELKDAAAVFGNGGHESGGFKTLQEISPTIKGSAGGYGWFQWTGPRRRAFNAFCKKYGLNPASDEANYGFLVYELKTTERAALKALRDAPTLKAKVIKFELAFERAGVKHYPSRQQYAARAVEVYNSSLRQKTSPKVKEALQDAAAVDRLSTTEMAGGAVAVSGAVSAVNETLYTVNEATNGIRETGPWLLLAVVTIGFGAYIIYERRRKRNVARKLLIDV